MQFVQSAESIFSMSKQQHPLQAVVAEILGDNYHKSFPLPRISQSRAPVNAPAMAAPAISLPPLSQLPPFMSVRTRQSVEPTTNSERTLRAAGARLTQLTRYMRITQQLTNILTH